MPAGPPANLSQVAKAKDWIAGARPRTLTAALAPVLVGTSIAIDPEASQSLDQAIDVWRFALTLLVALALQIGVNYANDYSDGIRGADQARIGPKRLVASGAATPKQVLTAAAICFAAAAAAGLVLTLQTSWWLIPVGAAAITAAYFYTGGKHPYGYAGFGEAAVMLFFGLVATVGTAYIQTEEITLLAVVCGLGMGSAACALLTANNLRDITADREAGKRTLSVIIADRLGRKWARSFYLLFWIAAAGAVIAADIVYRPWAFLGLLAPLLAIMPARRVLKGEDASPMVLRATGGLLAIYGVTFATGLALG